MNMKLPSYKPLHEYREKNGVHFFVACPNHKRSLIRGSNDSLKYLALAKSILMAY